MLDVIRLDKSYHKDILEFFGEDSEKFYFLISDLQKNSILKDSFKVFGEFEDNELKSILLYNFDNLTYYSNTERNVEVYKDVLKTLHFEKLTGPSYMVEKFTPLVEVKDIERAYMGYVDEVAKRRYPELNIEFIVTEEELEKQYDLLMSTEEYQNVLPKDREIYVIEQKEHINKNSRTAYLMIDDKMIASCSTISEYGKSAIVGGVVTDPAYRNRGYGGEVLTVLLQSLRNEGKYPYLFYNNPAARSLYKKIGVIEVCEWSKIIIK